jgi:hypothetical protein
VNRRMFRPPNLATSLLKSSTGAKLHAPAMQLRSSRRKPANELTFHLIWFILIGLIAGVIAKSVMHTQMTIFWTIVLGIIGSIIGGAVTHMFAPAAARTAPDRSTHEPDREQTETVS